MVSICCFIRRSWAHDQQRQQQHSEHGHPDRPSRSPGCLARRARRAVRTHNAILILGANGDPLHIEPLKPEPSFVGPPAPLADQLALRAKRLFKGQVAQLITYTVTLEA